MLAASMSLSATAQITVDQPNGPIVLSDGSGSGSFTLTGDGPLHLDHGIVADKTTLTGLPDVTVKLTRDGPDANIPASLVKGQTLRLRADVTNVKGASAVTIPLFNGSEPLQKQLEADAVDAPLNVTISGDGAPGTPLVLNPDKPAFVMLKNGDAEAYTLRWEFRYREMELCNTIALLGNGNARVALRAGSDVYSWSDSIRPSSQTGHLELGLDTGEPCCNDKAPTECKAAAGNDSLARTNLPTRDLPVSLTMQRATATRTTIYADLYVIACLIFGGLISLLASAVLPNSLRKSAFRQQLRDLANRTTAVSLRVDSNLRVLLRLERNRIGEALRNTWLISPSASGSLDDVATQVDQLTKRLGVAERIDDLRGKLEASYGTSPPSVVEEVDASLQAAADAMHSYALSSDDVDTATKSMDAAEKVLGTLENSADLAQEIASKFVELKTRLANFLPNYSDLKTAMPGVFGVLLEPFYDAKKITPRMVYAIDYCIAAINTALDFAVVRQEVPAEGQILPADAGKALPPDAHASMAVKQGQTSSLQQSMVPVAPGQALPVGGSVADGAGVASVQATEPVKYITPEPPNDVVNKARKHQEELTRLLSSMAWQALREARLLVQEMREDTYEEDVLRELTPDRARVAFETMRARPYLPINFYVHYLKVGAGDASGDAAAVVSLVIPERFGRGWHQGLPLFHRKREGERGGPAHGGS